MWRLRLVSLLNHCFALKCHYCSYCFSYLGCYYVTTFPHKGPKSYFWLQNLEPFRGNFQILLDSNICSISPWVPAFYRLLQNSYWHQFTFLFFQASECWFVPKLVFDDVLSISNFNKFSLLPTTLPVASFIFNQNRLLNTLIIFNDSFCFSIITDKLNTQWMFRLSWFSSTWNIRKNSLSSSSIKIDSFFCIDPSWPSSTRSNSATFTAAFSHLPTILLLSSTHEYFFDSIVNVHSEHFFVYCFSVVAFLFPMVKWVKIIDSFLQKEIQTFWSFVWCLMASFCCLIPNIDNFYKILFPEESLLFFKGI